MLAGLPDETVTLGKRQQLCVPVQKNQAKPPSGVIDFVRYVDLSCYQISGINVNRALTLSHLNPVLADLPAGQVTMTVPQQLCVPVVKNGDYPPAEVLRLVQYIDLKCYLITPSVSISRSLTLTQLDPVLAGAPVTSDTVLGNKQLCVPVQKNHQVIPADVLAIIRWIDLEKYDMSGLYPSATLTLNHINPLLTGLPAESMTFQLPQVPQLAVPVAKNGSVPPA